MENDEIYKIFDESKNLSEVLTKFGKSDNSKNWNYIKDLAKTIGFDIELYKIRKYKYCLSCNKKLENYQKKFCSSSCSATFNNTGNTRSDDTKNKISKSYPLFSKI